MMFEKLLEAIVGLTNALNAHAAALAANPTKATSGKKAATETPAQTAGAAAPNTVTPASPAATSPPVQSAAGTSASSGGATSQEAGAAMVRVANEISRDAAVAILGKFGAQTFAGVKPGDYAAFLAACNAALTPPPAAAPAGAAGLF